MISGPTAVPIVFNNIYWSPTAKARLSSGTHLEKYIEEEHICKAKWRQKIVLAHLEESLKLFSKSFNSFFVFCFVFEVFQPETVTLFAILYLILPH